MGLFRSYFLHQNATSQVRQLEKGNQRILYSIDFFAGASRDLIRLKVVKAVLHDDTTSTEGILVSKTFKTHYYGNNFYNDAFWIKLMNPFAISATSLSTEDSIGGQVDEFAASRAFNGDLNSYFLSSSHMGFPSWIEHDFRNVVEVCGIHIYGSNRARLPYRWKFQGSVEPERYNYSDIFSIPVSNYNSTSTEDPTCDTILHAQFPIKPCASYRYYRIVVDQTVTKIPIASN